MKFFLAFLALVGTALAAEENAAANPIRRVVTILQKMSAKTVAEGEAQGASHAKYMCYCKSSSAALDTSIGDANTKIPQLESTIEELTANIETLTSELAQHETDRSDAQASIASATEKRNSELATFTDESNFHKTNIGALSEAIPAIEKGMAGSFLQTNSGRVLRQVLSKVDDNNKEAIMAFLQGGEGYNAQSGEIVGILKQMKDDMSADLASITETENAAIASFNSLVAAKEKEIAAAGAAIEDKTARKGDASVALANAKHDLKDTQASLADDTKFAADLKASCATQEKNWEAIKEMRQQEVAAIAETIEILNSDDALELFKKTLPSSSSFLQMETSSKQVRNRALKMLSQDKRFGFIALALRGKQGGFEKVIGMINDMVGLLGEEQKDDDSKKEWCGAEFDKTDDSIKELSRKKNGLDAKAAETSDAIQAAAEEIEALHDSITALDKQVADATATRKEDHADYVTEKANNNAALQVLDVAKNRLNKFYNPAMHKAPQTPVPTEEQRQYFAATGEIPPELTPAPVEYVGKVEALVQGAPPPPPAALPAYKKKASSGVIGMMDSIINDVKSEMQDNDMEEKEAQKDYENMTAEAAAKRADDSERLSSKEGEKADLEEVLASTKHTAGETGKELHGTKKYLANVHGDCDWLVSNYGSRKEARTSEIEALKNAKAVLSGADYSFVQKKVFLQRRQ